MRANNVSALNILVAARECIVERVLHRSTSKIYDTGIFSTEPRQYARTVNDGCSFKIVEIKDGIVLVNCITAKVSKEGHIL